MFETTSASMGTSSMQLGIKYNIVRLFSWPDLPQIDAELIPDVARICALLAIRPTSAMLIPVLVGVTRERAEHIVEMLHVQGHLDQDAGIAFKTSTALESVPPPQEPNPTNKLLGRLWERLAVSWAR